MYHCSVKANNLEVCNVKDIIGLFVNTSVIFGAFMLVSSIANANHNHITNIHNSENVALYTKCQNYVIANTYCFQEGDDGDYIQNISALLLIDGQKSLKIR